MLEKFGSTLVSVNKLTQPAAESGQGVLGKCVFAGLIVRPDGTNEVTLNVYDNTEAAGNRLLPSNITVPGYGGLWTVAVYPGVTAEVGIYVDLIVAGSGSVEYQVLYDE